MIKIFIGRQCPLVSWARVGDGGSVAAILAYFDRRMIDVCEVSVGDGDDALVEDLLSVFAVSVGVNHEIFEGWRIAHLGSDFGYVGLDVIREILSSREENSRLAEMYRNSFEQKCWVKLGDDFQCAMWWFDLARRLRVRGETVKVLCDWVNGMVQVRDGLFEVIAREFKPK
jgi:hypothetical protein